MARAADWLNRFLRYKITNFPNNRTISQDICTLFARYLYSTLCSWIIISTFLSSDGAAGKVADESAEKAWTILSRQ